MSGKARIFFPEFNIRLYDKNSESDFFFPPPKSEYFFQQHWESDDDIKRTNFKNFVRLRSEDEVTGDNESGIKNISINHDMTSQGKGRVQSFNCRG